MINEIGNIYGKLTVLKRALRPEGRPKGAYWLCQCECGTQKIIRGADLRAGSVNSCGCLLGKHSIKNEVGNIYGRLTVISISNERKNGSVCWNCKCSCGKHVIVAGDELRRGGTKSCGCLVRTKSRESNSVDRTGKTYNKLTAISIDEERTIQANHGLYWHCQCECGNFTSVLGTNLANGSVKSCGCLKNSYGEEVIETLLIQHNVPYIKEYCFSDLKSDLGGALRFDFAILDNYKNVIHLIEYDGEQHFKAVELWGGNEGLKRRIENDRKKDLYCEINNLKLTRIPYWKLSNLTFKDLEVNINELSHLEDVSYNIMKISVEKELKV